MRLSNTYEHTVSCTSRTAKAETVRNACFNILLKKRGQVILRHPKHSAYRCFLPDLAGFTGFCCTGPSPLFLPSDEAESKLNRRTLEEQSFLFESHPFSTEHLWCLSRRP